ncbi:MAG: sulfotransferase family 2 domain-containing protein [Pseudomonadota bacterium]
MTIINRTWGFIFVHIPKTGGTSIAHALSPLCTWQDIELGGTRYGEKMHQAFGLKHRIWKHSFASEIRDVVGRGTWGSMTSFALVRDPVERTLSTFRYLRHHRSHYSFMDDITSIDALLMSPHWSEHGPDRMFLPQTRYLCRGPDNDLLVDYVIRLEDLDERIQPLLNDIGIPRSKIAKLVFEQKNTSPRLEEDELEPRHLEMIAERYADDYQILGYPPPILA